MKDIIKINDILSSIKLIRNYQKRAELNQTIDSLLSEFLPENLKQEIKAFSLRRRYVNPSSKQQRIKSKFYFYRRGSAFLPKSDFT